MKSYQWLVDRLNAELTPHKVVGKALDYDDEFGVGLSIGKALISVKVDYVAWHGGFEIQERLQDTGATLHYRDGGTSERYSLNDDPDKATKVDTIIAAFKRVIASAG